MQGWDLALTVLRSYRDALPQASRPDAANGRVSVAMRHEDGLQQSAFSVTTHLVIVDVVATSYKGKHVCLHSEFSWSLPLSRCIIEVKLPLCQQCFMMCAPPAKSLLP